MAIDDEIETGLFSHEVVIPIKWGEPITIFFWGDRQAGTKGYSKLAWGVFKKAFKSTPNAYAIAQGDYRDFLRPSMRARILGGLAHDESAREQMDNLVMEDYWKELEDLSFMKGKILVFHEGHHDWKYADGTTASQKLAGGLKSVYGGWMARTRLVLKPTTKRGVTGACGFNYYIISMHGSGSARKASTDAGWLETNIYPYWEADAIARGHSTKLNATPLTRNYPKVLGPPGNHEKIRWMINSGGFHRGYTNGWETSYVARNGFPPSALGWSTLTLWLRQSSGNKERAYRKPGELHSAYIYAEAKTRPIQQEELAG